MRAAMSGAGPPSSLVDSPTSRLSKRTTWNPRLARAWHQLSSHHTIWADSPMIKSMAGSVGRPVSSYSSSMPLTRARGMPDAGLSLTRRSRSHVPPQAGRLGGRQARPRGEEAVHLGVGARVQAQAAPDEGHVRPAVQVTRPGWPLEALRTGLDTRLPEESDGVLQTGALGPVKAVEVAPQVVEPRLGMGGGDLHDHPAPGMLGEGGDKGGGVGHVVEHMVADDHVGRAHLAGHLGPGAR